jgi:superfamily II DNA or RNA helicase
VIVENEFKDIEETKTTRINVQDKWNVNELCNHIISNKRVMIRAKLPGSGKSYVCEYLVKLGYNVLFVCPTNKLAQKYKEAGLTVNKFYGVGFTENGEKKKARLEKGLIVANTML